MAQFALPLPPGREIERLRLGPLVRRDPAALFYAARDLDADAEVGLLEFAPPALAGRAGGPIQPWPGAADPFGLALIAFRARLREGVRHRALPRVHRVLLQAGTALAVTAPPAGVPLAERWPATKAPPTEPVLLALLLELAAAAEALHQAGSVHGHILADTVMLVEDGRPTLLPCGRDLAWRLAPIAQVPGAVPAELLEEGAGGPPADVYMLAALGLSLLKGAGPPPALGRLIADRLESAGTRARVATSPALVAALDRALAPHPQDRPVDIAAWRALLLESPHAPAAWQADLVPVVRAGPPEAPVEEIAEAAPAPLAPAGAPALAPAEASDPLLLLRRAVASGDALAMLALAERHDRGEGVARDPAQALELVRRAAEAGSAEAGLALGRRLLVGDGAPADERAAARALARAAAAGQREAAFLAGQLVEAGLGEGEPDPEAAARLYRQAGSAAAINALGRLAERAGAAAEAARHYERAGQQGDADALFNLARLAETGRGRPANPTLALQRYRAAAQAGRRPALACLRVLEAGEAGRAETETAGLGRTDAEAVLPCFDPPAFEDLCPPLRYDRPAHDPEAVAHARAGAAEGRPRPLYVLALLHLEGLGVEADPAAAARLMAAAAEAGQAQAQHGLAHLKAFGLGLAEDPAGALDWALKAAGQKQAGAMGVLAAAAEAGFGRRRDRALARHWWQRAAEAGLVEARVALARFHAAGICGPPSPRAEREELETAARQGLAEAQFQLALGHDLGWLAEPSAQAAEVLYRQAARQGHAGALTNLGVFQASGRVLPADAAAALDSWTEAARLGSATAAWNLALAARAEGDTAAWAGWIRRASALGHARARDILPG